MHKDELLGLLQQTGGLDPEVAEPIADRPAPEVHAPERPTRAIDPGELRALVQPPVLPVFRGRAARWPWVVALVAAVTTVVLLLA